MKKIFLFLMIVLTMSAYSSSKVVSLPGGIYAADFDQRGEVALRYGLAEMGVDNSNYQLSLYKKS